MCFFLQENNKNIFVKIMLKMIEGQISNIRFSNGLLIKSLLLKELPKAKFWKWDYPSFLFLAKMSFFIFLQK